MIRGTAGVCVFGSAMAIVLGPAAPTWAHGTTEQVSVGPGGIQANGPSFELAISSDRRFVAFASAASNLVPGDTNGVPDVFVRTLAP